MNSSITGLVRTFSGDAFDLGSSRFRVHRVFKSEEEIFALANVLIPCIASS